MITANELREIAKLVEDDVDISSCVRRLQTIADKLDRLHSITDNSDLTRIFNDLCYAITTNVESYDMREQIENLMNVKILLSKLINVDKRLHDREWRHKIVDKAEFIKSGRDYLIGMQSLDAVLEALEQP